MKRWLITFILVAGCSVPSEFTQQAAEHEDDCTLTQGYWKNHEAQWPVSTLTLGAASYDQQELLALLDSPTQGDASLILAHQLIAALLNIENGAVPGTATQDALDGAQSWMVDNVDADGRLAYGVTSGSAHETGTTLSDALDAFNNGVSGPGHCDDPESGDDDDDDDGDDDDDDDDGGDDDDDDNIGTEPLNTPTPTGDLD